MSQTNITELLAPHFEVIGEAPLTAGVSVVSVTTAEGTNITSTTRYTGGTIDAQCTYNDNALTTPQFGATVEEKLNGTVDALAAIIAGGKE